jgi:hypothetical protein
MFSKEKMYGIFEEMFSFHFSKFFSTVEEIAFIESLKAITDLYVFSGILRDFLLGYNKEDPRDFDFVIGESNKETKKIIKKYLVRQTQFGGFKCRINNKDVDIWSVQDTWAIKKYRPFYIQNYLPLTAFFNITAAIYCLNTNKLYIHDSFKEFLEDIKHQKLDIVLEDNPFPALCIVKTFELMDKFDLPLSDRLKDYILRYNKILTEGDFHDVQMKHFGLIKYDYSTIKERINNLYNRLRIVDKLKSYNNQMLLFDKHDITKSIVQMK